MEALAIPNGDIVGSLMHFPEREVLTLSSVLGSPSLPLLPSHEQTSLAHTSSIPSALLPRMEQHMAFPMCSTDVMPVLLDLQNSEQKLTSLFIKTQS